MFTVYVHVEADMHDGFHARNSGYLTLEDELVEDREFAGRFSFDEAVETLDAFTETPGITLTEACISRE